MHWYLENVKLPVHFLAKEIGVSPISKFFGKRVAFRQVQPLSNWEHILPMDIWRQTQSKTYGMHAQSTDVQGATRPNRGLGVTSGVVHLLFALCWAHGLVRLTTLARYIPFRFKSGFRKFTFDLIPIRFGLIFSVLRWWVHEGRTVRSPDCCCCILLLIFTWAFPTDPKVFLQGAQDEWNC